MLLAALTTSFGDAASGEPVSAWIPFVLAAPLPSTSLAGTAVGKLVPARVPLALAASALPTSPGDVALAEPVAAWLPLTPATPPTYANTGGDDAFGQLPHGRRQQSDPPARAHSLLMSLLRLHNILALLWAASILILMVGGGGATNPGYRTPPAWGPEMADRYPFRTWARHVLIWSILTDLDARRKAAAVILQLRGGAAELIESLPPQAIIAGGVINGVNVDPMTFLMHALSERYAQLGEETRLSAITELMNFARHGRERVDDLITRFDRIRQRANQEGQMTMSVQGLSWILLRACQVNDTQLLTLLQPFGGLFPADAGQYATLTMHLRRMGHIIERSPGNIASQLRVGSNGGSPQPHFFAGEGSQGDPWQEPSNDPWGAAFAERPTPAANLATTGSYWGTSSGSQPGQSWQPQIATPTYAMQDDWNSDNGTDTDTVSSVDDHDYELPLPATASPNAVASHLFWAYQQAKSRWRNFMGKPVRAIRRFVRRKGKGKGKGKGKSGKAGAATTFLAATSDEEVDQIFLGKGRGKGSKGGHKGKRSSGKGKGRRLNPFGPDGERMKCNSCGAEDHFIRECTQERAHGGAGANHGSSFYAVPPIVAAPSEDDGPLAGVLQQSSSVFMMQESLPAQPYSTVESWPSPWLPAYTQADTLPQATDSTRFDTVAAAAAQAGASWATPQPSLISAASALGPPPSAAVTVTAPPPELPDWANFESFGFAQTETLQRELPPSLLPLFTGAAGSEPAISTLGPTQLDTVADHRNMEATLEHWYTYGIAPRPSQTATSTLDGQHHSFINQFWQVQQHNTTMLRRKGSGKAGKGPTSPFAEETLGPARDLDGVIDYDGDDSACSICLDEFEGGQWCLRLICRHLFHVECFNDVLIRGGTGTVDRCPNCRGSARIAARFRFIAAPPTHNIATPAASPAASADSFRSVLSVATALPWYPAAGAQPAGYYHASTKLPGGRLGILVDPGAWTNIGGKNNARKVAAAAVAAGHQPTQKRMDRPLAIQGVGNGVQRCDWEVDLPIAVPCDQDTVHLHRFETPIVEEPGEELPLILGLRSMSEKEGVLEMGRGKERLTFPGPGGYTIQWSPGSRHFPLEPAPSGHLIMPCGEYGRVQQSSGLQRPTTTFHATSKSRNGPDAEDSTDGAAGVRLTSFSRPGDARTSVESIAAGAASSSHQ